MQSFKKILFLSFLYTRLQILEQLRQPVYIFSILLVPCMFFIFFIAPGLKHAQNTHAITSIICYAFYAFLGVVFTQTSMQISINAEKCFSDLLKTLPYLNHPQYIGRIFSQIILGCISMILSLVLAYFFFQFEMNIYLVRTFIFIILVSLPLCLLGIIIGLLFSIGATQSVSMGLYLSLSFAGGLWMPIEKLPSLAQKISPFLPTRACVELLRYSLDKQHHLDLLYLMSWCIYTLLFIGVLFFSTQRQQSRIWN